MGCVVKLHHTDQEPVYEKHIRLAHKACRAGAIIQGQQVDLKIANGSKSELTFQHLAQRVRQVDSHAPAYSRDATAHGRQHAVHHAVGSLWQTLQTARNEPAAWMHLSEAIT